MPIFSYFKPINAALSPNTERDDILKVLKYFLPWNIGKWKVGTYSDELEIKLKEYFGVKNAVVFSSGRTGLAAILESIREVNNFDKNKFTVLTQAYTTIAIPLAIKKAGFSPVYVDIGEDDYNIDPEKIEAKITPQAKILIVQHTFGIPAKMDRILAVALKHQLIVIEDCAHSLGAEFKGKKAGTFGDAAFFSFGRDKIISSVSGGAVITGNILLAEKIRSFERKLPFPPHVWIFQQLIHPILFWCALPFYYLFNLGKAKIYLAQKAGLISRAYEIREKLGDPDFNYSFKMPNVLAGLVLGQFKKLERYNDHRRRLDEFYRNALRSNERIKIIKRDPINKYTPLYFTIQAPKRNNVLQYAAKNHIILGDWFPGALGPAGINEEKFGYQKGDCPIAEKVGARSLNLPTNIRTGLDEAKKVVKTIADFLNKE